MQRTPQSVKDGVIVGTDHQHEWLLSWWWSHYAKHNTYPVTFADFGMSRPAREWCAERGNVIAIEKTKLASKANIDAKNIKNWTEVFGEVMWKSRASWFMKPQALAKTPYQRTIWVDLDCEILCSLWPLFETCECPSGLAMVQESEAIQKQELERGILLPGEVTYNTGLLVFKKNALIVSKWAEAALDPSEFSGDQHLLCRLIFTNKVKVNEISPDYNWRVCRGLNINAKIVHWVGNWGKQFIRRYGGYQEFIRSSAKK